MSANPHKFDHIVVLMLENRSFDHMLGYLTLEKGRTDIQGLSGAEYNTVDGQRYGVFHLNRNVIANRWSAGQWRPDPQQWNTPTQFGFVEPSAKYVVDSQAPRKYKVIDPFHFFDCVSDQMQNSNGGFAQDFHDHYPGIYPGLVMGYYNDDELFAFDFLAREYLICNRWFSSVPGPTVPNRVYSLCGTTHGEVVQPDFENLFLPAISKYRNIATIFDHLDWIGIEWAYYYHDVPFLALLRGRTWITALFRALRIIKPVRWLQFRLRNLWFKLGQKRSGIAPIKEFKTRLRRAKRPATGVANFPAVSWIDPDWAAFGNHYNSNDDHPPSDVRRGQELVCEVYEAIRSSGISDRILLVVTYDEHGGFYDHVEPSPATDEWAHLRTYGIRVPAFIVSSHVDAASVSDLAFDHASILKTILARFCCDDSGPITNWMSDRVKDAEDLSQILSGEKRQMPECPRPRGRVGEEDSLEPPPNILVEPTELQMLIQGVSRDAW